jgi:hypothetical protein
MTDLNVSIIKYLGKVEDGIIVLVNISAPSDDISFDATFYYTDTKMILTISEELEEILGDIKILPEYPQILRLCLRKVVPYNELINSIDPLDVKPYLKEIFPDKNFDE